MHLLRQKIRPILLCSLALLYSVACTQQATIESTEEHDKSVQDDSVVTSKSTDTIPVQGIREQLKNIARDQDYINHPDIMRKESIDWIETQLERQNASPPPFSLHWDYGSTLLNTGESHRAIDEFRKLRENLEKDSPSEFRENVLNIDLSLAMSFLRIGEQENCLENHSPESCLFPIKRGGIHLLKEGSTNAKNAFAQILEEHPDNTDALWLYNITAMTLGEYPDKVPAKWLIRPSHFISQESIGRFPEIAASAGLDVNGLAGGCVVDDFDNDFDLDVMVSSWDIDDPIRLFINRSDGTFEDRSDSGGLDGISGGLNLIQGDYDNDGFVDILVLRGAWLGKSGQHPNSLLRNNGDGSFEDVTEKAGLLSYHPTQTATWFDYNLDGFLDLFIGNEYRLGRNNPCELFHNNGDGTFTDRAAELGLSVRKFVKGVTSSDFNNDGRPDLYISCLGNRNFLYQNRGPDHKEFGKPKYFSEVGRTAGVTDPLDSFGTWFFDYNNDGNTDLFVIGYRINSVGDFVNDYRGQAHNAAFSKLYRNDGNGKFQDVTVETGLNRILLGMGVNYGDLDNDGYLDFYVGTGNPELMTLTPNRMFRNNRGKSFQDITESGGFGHLQKGHGISFADLNQDGNQDVYAVMGGAVSGDVYRNALFENPGHDAKWLKLKLEGRASNRSAIGAKVKVVTRTSTGPQTFYSDVSSGGSFGANPLMIEIGLADAESIVSLEIHWPTPKKHQTFSDLEVNSLYHIIEDETTPKKVPLKPFIIQRAPHSGHQH